LETFDLVPGEAVHIQPGTCHRMTAIVDTVVLEASTTELADVVRPTIDTAETARPLRRTVVGLSGGGRGRARRPPTW
jgi:hypothetical protein